MEEWDRKKKNTERGKTKVQGRHGPSTSLSSKGRSHRGWRLDGRGDRAWLVRRAVESHGLGVLLHDRRQMRVAEAHPLVLRVLGEPEPLDSKPQALVTSGRVLKSSECCLLQHPFVSRSREKGAFTSYYVSSKNIKNKRNIVVGPGGHPPGYSLVSSRAS